MVIDGDGDGSFGIFLPDDILIEMVLDLFWFQNPKFVKRGFFVEDACAQSDAMITDKDVGPGDELLYIGFFTSTEGTGWNRTSFRHLFFFVFCGGDDFINKTIIDSLLGTHEKVSLGVFENFIYRLLGALG